jgi:hypothetical protein
MQGRWGRWVGVGLVGMSFAASVSAESMAEAAKRERERRAKVQAENAEKPGKSEPAKSYTESDLENAKGENFTVATGPVIPYYPEASSSLLNKDRTGATASQPAPSGGSSSVAALQQRVSDLERQRAALPPGPFGAGAACTEGAIVRGMDGPVALKNAPKYRVCDRDSEHAREAQRVQAELDRARAALAQAQSHQ